MTKFLLSPQLLFDSCQSFPIPVWTCLFCKLIRPAAALYCYGSSSHFIFRFSPPGPLSLFCLPQLSWWKLKKYQFVSSGKSVCVPQIHFFFICSRVDSRHFQDSNRKEPRSECGCLHHANFTYWHLVEVHNNFLSTPNIIGSHRFIQ